MSGVVDDDALSAGSVFGVTSAAWPPEAFVASLTTRLPPPEAGAANWMLDTVMLLLDG